jgi:hypothetical protein
MEEVAITNFFHMKWAMGNFLLFGNPPAPLQRRNAHRSSGRQLPTRSAFARIVRLVFTASDDGIAAPSVTYNPGYPNTSPAPFTTPSARLSAIRADPV